MIYQSPFSVRILMGLISALIGLGFVVSSVAQETPVTAPTIATIESLIAKFQSDATLNDVQKTRNVELLELAISRINETAEFKQRAQEYVDSIENASQKQMQAENELQRISELNEPADFATVRLNELELRLTQQIAEQQSLQGAIDQLELNIKTEKSFDIAKAIEEMRASMEGDSELQNDPLVIDRTARIVEVVNRNVQQAQIIALEQRQLSRTARLAHWEAEKTLLQQQYENANNVIAQMRVAINNNRQSAAKRIAVEARRVRTAVANAPQPIVDLAKQNVLQADELVALIANHDRIIRQSEIRKQERDRLERRFESLTEQLETSQLASSPEFGSALRKLRDQLKRVDRGDSGLRELETTLTQVRLAQFQTDELRTLDAQTQKQQLYALLRASETIDDVNGLGEQLDQLLADRNTILQQLAESYPNYIRDLSRLIAVRTGAVSDSERFASELDQHLLWMPSAMAMNLDSFVTLAPAVAWFLKPANWAEVVKAALYRLGKAPFPGLLGLLGVVALLSVRGRSQRRLNEVAKFTGIVEADSYKHTVSALLATFVLTIPVPLAMYVVAGLVDQNSGFASGVARAIRTTGDVLFVLLFVYHTVRDNGLADKHFKWQRHTIERVRRELLWFMVVFLPIILINIIVETQGTGPIRDSLGRLAFIASAVVLAVFLGKLFNMRSGLLTDANGGAAGATNSFTQLAKYALLILPPIVVVGFSFAGYHYTAIKLYTYLIESAFVLILSLYLYWFARRWFAIGEARLAREIERARQAQEQAQSVDHETTNAALNTAAIGRGIQDVDLRLLRSQTNALLRTIVVVFLALSFWHIWSDFAPAFKPLEEIRLWSAEKIIEDELTLTSVTLFDLLLAFAVALITFLAAKNIPALIEVALRNRRSLESGTSYTITTVSRYILVIVGSVLTLQLLGAQWSKLQWLVAALSVGLGFGLQEIVANFVSGIVILFERPFRIGDTVTVGEQWGTVNKIRIRATTILDWDRRELIIPNKTFITERLVNWTLTDPITRTTISVGVAYGSDVALVEKLLHEIALGNSRVLNEPQPTVLFRRFGESSLDFDVRVYVRGVHDLIPVAHSMHVAIDKEFREHGVEISFPQRDIHFDPKPLEIKIIGEDGTDAT